VAEARESARAAGEVLAEAAAQPGGLRALVLADPAAAAWSVRCALATGIHDVARRVVDTAEHLRVRNLGVPAVVAAAVHARGLAEGDAQALARAGGLHRNPWARAAAAEDHAGLLLESGDRDGAVGALDRALAGYGALGGERDAARVRAVLRRLGVRRRHWTQAKRPASGWESLTRTERKVAELVACGLTNRQAARRLFVSPHTVGFHLRQIYRKLGIRSRTALARFTT
jgi:DNA-binding CsgD family transcriptional regulator